MHQRWRTAARTRPLTVPAVVGSTALSCPLLLVPPLSQWSVLCAVLAQVALLVALLPSVVLHLAASARVALLGAAASATSGSALLLALLAGAPTAWAPGAAGAQGLLVVLGCATALAVLATVTALHARRSGDGRPLVLAAFAVVVLAVPVVRLLAPAAPGALTLPLLAGLVVVGGSTAIALLHQPEPVRVRDSPWDGDLVVHAITSCTSVGVLALQDVSRAPLPWSLALVALCLGAVKLVGATVELRSLRTARRSARHDGLTGLADRGALLAELDLAVARGGPAALLLLDVDGFRRLNDALGHAVGDELLRSVAGRLRDAVRGELADGRAVVLARLGSDEFAVLLTGAAAARASALATAAAVHEALCAPHEVGGRAVVAAAHTGVVVEPAAGGMLPLDLLRRADVAMHRARTRRSGPVEHDRQLDAAVRESVELVGELRRGLEGGEVGLHFQPQVDVLTGRVRGTEALVRWAHPERGVLTPDVFLPVAAEAGLMGRLTSVVLDTAIRQAAAWDRAGTPVPVSVNLTATDVRPELVDEVAQLLVREQLPASLLVLEITETVLVVDPAGTAAVLADLVELGVEVSIDDFGTGYSSLEVLLSLPVTELKIDRTFVSRALADVARHTVVRSTIDLAHGLGLRVVAEGVEDDDVLRLLRELGCDVSQGYLHSRPLAAPEATAWLAAHADPAPTSPHEAVPG